MTLDPTWGAVIWKYPLQVTDEQLLELPEGAELLCVQVQNGIPCLWARVNPSVPVKRKYLIRTLGTGREHQKYPHERYLSTYQLLDGRLVYHVFVGD